MGNFPTEIRRKPAKDQRYVEIAAALESEGITRAYTSFWDSHALWFYSDGKIETAALIGDKNELRPYIWLTNLKWYDPEFYMNSVVLSDNAYGVTKELVVDVFGEPQREETVQDAEIMIYDKNLAPSVSR